MSLHFRPREERPSYLLAWGPNLSGNNNVARRSPEDLPSRGDIKGDRDVQGVEAYGERLAFPRNVLRRLASVLALSNRRISSLVAHLLDVTVTRRTSSFRGPAHVMIVPSTPLHFLGHYYDWKNVLTLSAVTTKSMTDVLGRCPCSVTDSQPHRKELESVISSYNRYMT